jgi:hypothetical protein
MKLIKTASGKQTIKLSKSEWETIGKTAGWMGGSEDKDKDEEEKGWVQEKVVGPLENKVESLIDEKMVGPIKSWTDNALSTLKTLGIGALTGAALAKILSALMHKSVEKIKEESEKKADIQRSYHEVQYKSKEQEWIERIQNGENVSEEEVRQAKEDLINAIEQSTRGLNTARNTIAFAVDKVADAIGSKYGTAAFSLAGLLISKTFFLSHGNIPAAISANDKIKIVKTASGKRTIKISKSAWESIGKQAGWMKEAGLSPEQWGEIQKNPKNQETQNELNLRQRVMVNFYNKATGQDVPLDEEGYNSLGRGQGIVRKLVAPEYRENLMKDLAFATTCSQMGLRDEAEVMTLDPKHVANILKKYFLTISRKLK